MAAHVVTALEQVLQDIKYNRVNFDYLESALNLSCWTEDLDYPDYDLLCRAVANKSISDLYFWRQGIGLKYRAIWLNLGQPATREEWRVAKWGEK